MTKSLEQVRLGLLKTTLVDYPGLVAATVFTAGCNIRCPYCHNPELVTGPPPPDFLPAREVIDLIGSRKRMLDGVCITGGEPLVHGWLPDLASTFRGFGLKVKLDTNGAFPRRIPAVSPDYIALDIKTDPAHYERVGGAVDIAAALESVRSSGAEYEIRTTVLESIVTREDIEAIVSLLRPGERFTLTAFRPGKTLDPALSNRAATSHAVLENYALIARNCGLNVTIRDHSR